ncbi:uncharacterized protein LOC113331583 [Papaver somniferum]|uniref:uncharacterized protein LOC113331583 n=1 Tax=Papaver somniferum TaxID=3469 RepID=UPI000E702F11|nr:uncharacterized protein LOC113331583 [Papaver somniferum]
MGVLNFVLRNHEKYSQHLIDTSEADIFLKKLEEENLTDLGYTECPFTWTNRRLKNQLTEQRLDIGLATDAWLDIFPNSTISNLPSLRYDHNPIILNTNPNWKQGHIPFKFFGPWLNHQDCKDIIVECWKKNHKGSFAIRIARKLRDVKVMVILWKKEIYGNIKTNLEDSLQHLDWVTKNQFSINRERDINGAKKKVEHWQNVQECFWKTKSRDQLIKLGDRNTKFFHDSTKKRYKWNKIDYIQKEDGTWIHNSKDVTN